MRRIIRGLLAAAFPALIAGSVFLAPMTTRAESAAIGAVAVDRLKVDAFSALKRGEFERSSQLLRQAASGGSDPKLELMASWVTTFTSQYAKTLADRKTLYEKAVAQVKLLEGKGKSDYAMDSATRAYLLVIDKRAFRTEGWVDALLKSRTAAALEYEKTGLWHLAARLYMDLGAVEPANPVWKSKLKIAGRHVRIQALYTPDLFKALLQSKQKEDDLVDGMLEAAGILTRSATTRPATQPAEGLDGVDAKVDWRDLLRGIKYDMVAEVLNDAVENYYRPANYRELVTGGLNALRLFATTPEIDTAFATLANAENQAAFLKAIDQQLVMTSLAGENDFGAYRRVIEKLGEANDTTVKLPENVLTHEFLDGALGELDPFSSMIYPQQLEEFRTSTEGEFSGVGIEIRRDESGALMVISPIEDSPAYRGGIKAGDSITHVNGSFVKGMMLDQAIKKIKGPTGTKVTLTVRSPDGKIQDHELKRDTIKVASIKGWKRQPGGGWEWMIDPVQRVGYVRLTSFTKTTAGDLDRAIQQLQDDGARGVILDLRANPGGLLSSAIDVADDFIKTGTIVSTRADRKTPQDPSIGSADPDTKKCVLPMIVLVNQLSASASEIVSGALKDQKRAIIVGERSYGKGSVQMLFGINGRSAALKLTTSHYYLPSGRCLHREETSTEWGVEPDYVIEMTPEQARAAMDARQQMDVLRALADKSGKEPTTKPADLLDVDPQLSAAVMLLRFQVAGVKL